MRLVLVRPLLPLALAAAVSALLVARGVRAEQQAGLIGHLLAPLHSTINHAMSLFGGGPADSRAASGGEERPASSSLSQQTYDMFRRLYNKTYASQEEIGRRMRLFYKRRQEIEQSIRDYAQGRLPFTMRENEFIDWDESELKALAGAAPPRKPEELLPEERQAIVRRRRISRRRRRRSVDVEPALERVPNSTWTNSTRLGEAVDERDELDDDDDDPLDDFELDDDEVEDDDSLGLNVYAPERTPTSKDWRLSKCISTPIDQQKCGCCYAIATMSVIESMRCINKVTAPLLSPQHIIDCSTPRAGYQNFGCNGGWPTRVLKYLQDTGVAVRERCYPFVRRQETCKLRQVQADPSCTVPASPTNTRLTYKVLNNERDILHHVAHTGPVVTVMRATNKFLFYSNGVFDDATCTRSRDDVDHAIVIVGYGRENGLDYWLIKNSWSTTHWGQGGFGKYRRGTNACSIGHWGWVITS